MARKYLIDRIFPTREVHLLAGPSGSGKTTWLLQTLQKWHKSEPIFDQPSHPSDFIYIACDRSLDTTLETMSRLGIPENSFPIMSLVDQDIPATIESILNAVRTANPTVKLLVIDGFATLLPGGDIIRPMSVANFLRHVTRLCKRFDLTIIGIVHTAKTKEGEGYAKPRERISGTTAWAAFCETVVLIEPVKADDPNDRQRKLYLLPRNHAESTHDYILDSHGCFVPYNLQTDVAYVQLDLWLRKQTAGDQFITYTIHEYAETMKIAQRTAERWLSDRTTSGQVERLKKGVYRKPRPA